MDHDHEPALRIGVFSTLTRISVRMLRHYQDHGVLAPSYVDPFSGYRYYAPALLARAHLVTGLRDAGFSVEGMREVLRVVDDPAGVEAALQAQRERLTSARDMVHGQLAALDRIGPTLKETAQMTDVRMITLPEMTVAALRDTIPTYPDEALLWQRLMPALGAAGAAFPADAICGATFFDPDYRECDVDVEVWLQVSGACDVQAPLVCRAEPAREVVTARLLGDYSQMEVVTSALGAFIAQNGLRTGPMFNIYRVTPAQNPDPSSWVTDVCFPVVVD